MSHLRAPLLFVLVAASLGGCLVRARPGVYYQPTYVAPRPVYVAPRPVVVQTQPVYVAPQPVVQGTVVVQ